MEKNRVFRFKQFAVDDSLCAMKVGTDGVLLGAWAPVDGVRRVLDVGTGCGVIALMVAQRTREHAGGDGCRPDACGTGTIPSRPLQHFGIR